MVVTRFTPRAVKMMLASEMLLLVGLLISARLGLTSRHEYLEQIVVVGFGTVACGVAIKLYLDIAAEYHNHRLPRLVWQAFAINAALMIIKIAVSVDALDVWIDNYHSSPLRGLLNHVVSVPASICLLVGLIGMLQLFGRTGLGTKLRGRDYLTIAISLALLGGLLLFHKSLEEGESPWMINRILQPIDLCLLAAASIMSMVLYRDATGMSGGRMAEALGWLVIYGLLPMVLVLLLQVAVPVIQGRVAFDSTPLDRLWALLPWMTTLAAAVRAEMTVEAVAQVAKLERFRAAQEM